MLSEGKGENFIEWAPRGGLKNWHFDALRLLLVHSQHVSTYSGLLCKNPRGANISQGGG